MKPTLLRWHHRARVIQAIRQLVARSAPMAALARISAAEPRPAERFEPSVAQLKWANGFGELICSVQQRRFVAAAQLRRNAHRRNYPLDEQFLAALDEVPPLVGIALGIERLLMFLIDAAHINEVAFIAWRES